MYKILAMQEGVKTTKCKDLGPEMSTAHNRLWDSAQCTESFWTLVSKAIKDTIVGGLFISPKVSQIDTKYYRI